MSCANWLGGSAWSRPLTPRMTRQPEGLLVGGVSKIGPLLVAGFERLGDHHSVHLEVGLFELDTGAFFDSKTLA